MPSMNKKMWEYKVLPPMNKIMKYDQDHFCILGSIFTWNNAIYEYKMKIWIYGAATYEKNHELAIYKRIIPVFTIMSFVNNNMN